MKRKPFFEDRQKIGSSSQDYNSIPEKRMIAFNRMYTRYMLELSSHELVPSNEADKQIGLKNKLTFKNPFDIFEKKADSIRKVAILKLIARILLFLLFGYCSLYTFSVAVYQYRHDLVLNDWQPKVRENAVQTKKCALKDDIYFATETKTGESTNDKLIEAKSMLLNIGAPAPSLTGVTTIWLGALCAIPVFLAYVIVYVVQYYDIRIDVLSYNSDIVKEKKRLHRDMCQIIDCMIHSTDYRIELRNDKLKIIQNNYYEIPPSILFRSPNSDRPLNNQQIRTINSKRKSYSLENKQAELFEADLVFKQYHLSNLNQINSIRASNGGEAKLLFIKTLLNPNILKMAEPSLLNLKWYRKMIFISFVYRIFVIFLGTIIILAMISYFMIGENYNRAKFRLEQVECLKWHPNGTVIMDTFQLNELPLEVDIKSYLNYDGSFKGLLKLALYVEFKYYCKTEVIISCVCLFLTLWPSLLVTTHNLTIYVQSFVDKAVWFYEINNHVDKSLEIMTRHKMLMESSLIISSKIIELSENEIMIALVVSYLKYELFRRQQSHYNLVTYTSLLIVAVFGTIALILCFFIGTTLKNCLNSFVLASATFAMMFGDFFVITCAIRTSQSEHFMRKITTLLARTTSIDIELWHIRKLWARQLLNETDIKQLFTPKFFTFSVSKKNILAANGYIVVFWWIYLSTKR